MAAFATAEDLASFLQVPTVDRYSAELALDLASDAVRAEVNQDIDVATTTEIHDGLPPTHPWANTIFLRQIPVTGISSVVSDGLLLVPTEYEWSAYGTIVRYSLPFSALLGGIAVTYTHGWATTSRQYRLARVTALQVAARCYVNPGQLDVLTIGSISRSFPKENDGRTGRVELTRYEQRRLDPLRR
jgi:hypothetical protein